MKRRVIIDLPKGQSGLEVKLKGLRAGLGFNANKLPWPIMAGEMSAPDVEVNSTLKPVPRSEANLEAEKGEVAALPTKSGIPDTFKIGGKRHHSGGTPLNLPSDSFIFSDTAKMKIKDVTILAQFGLPERKGGYTPAEIAKKYDVNSFKKVLADPDTDKLQKQTAEMMIANYNLKLAKLALVQESMKGFPQGIPMIAMPYIEEMQIDPAQFVQMNPGGADDEQAQTEQGEMDDVGTEAQGRFGGYMRDGGIIDYFDKGGAKYKDGIWSEAQYQESLLEPYSPEKKAAQIKWIQMKNEIAQEKADEQEKRQRPKTFDDISSEYFDKYYTKRHGEDVDEFYGDDGHFANPYSLEAQVQLGSGDFDKNAVLSNAFNSRYTPSNSTRVIVPFTDYKIVYDLDKRPTYKSEEEYQAHLLDPASPEKKYAQEQWLSNNRTLYGEKDLLPGFKKQPEKIMYSNQLIDADPASFKPDWEDQKQFQKDAATKDAFDLYRKALNSGNVKTIDEAVRALSNYDRKAAGDTGKSRTGYGGSDIFENLIDDLNNLSTELKQKNKPKKAYDNADEDAKLSTKADEVYAELYRNYSNPNTPAATKLDLKNQMNKAFMYTSQYKNLPGNTWAKPLEHKGKWDATGSMYSFDEGTAIDNLYKSWVQPKIDAKAEADAKAKEDPVKKAAEEKAKADRLAQQQAEAINAGIAYNTGQATTLQDIATEQPGTQEKPKRKVIVQNNSLSNLKPDADGLYEVNDLTPEEAAALGINL